MDTSEDKALELALNSLDWMDDAIQKFTSLESLPDPIDCKPGCHYCCFNQPMVTPPEALLVGHHVEHTFTRQEKLELVNRIKKIFAVTRARKPDEIVMMRYELPCVFLRNGMCSIYKVRPAICRACSSTSAEHCKMVFETRDHMARLRCYSHIREILQTAHTGLINSCQEMRCQSDLMPIADAVRDYLEHSRPIEAWIEGETVFHLRENYDLPAARSL